MDGSAAAAPLRGRGAELDLITRLVRDTRADDGPPAGVVIVGGPGIGKSSLWAHGVAAMRRAGTRVLSATCVEAEREMPYAGLDALLGDVLDEHGAALPAPQRRALDAALLRAPADGATDPRTVATGTLTLLRAVLDGGRALLAVDDLHWLDAETEQCLAYAVRRLDGRLVVLCTSREPTPLWSPREPAAGPPPTPVLVAALPAARTLRLPPLDAAAIRTMVRDRLGVALSPEDSRIIAAETGGNPLWALEFGRNWRGVVEGGSPPSIGILVADRIAHLDPPVVAAACLVAALGRPRPATVLPAIAPDDPDPGGTGERLLDQAVASGLLGVVDGRLTPSHPLIGAALLASLPPFRRRRLHRQAAGLADSAEARALHLLQATTHGGIDPDDSGGPARAELLGALDAACAAAGQRGAAGTAARFAARALAVEERHAAGRAGRALAGRRVATAELHYRAGDPDAALEVLERVEPGELDPDQLERAGPLLAQTTNERRGRAAARAVVDALDGLPRAGLSPAADTRRAALVATLRADLRCGATGDRRAIARSAVERAERSPTGAPLRRRALGALAHALLDAGDRVGEVLDRLAALGPADATEPGGDVDVAFLEGLRLMPVDPRRTRAVLDAPFERYLVTGDAPAAARAGALLAHAELLAGLPDAAEATLARLADHVERRSLELPFVVYTTGLVLLARGAHDALDDLLDQQAGADRSERSVAITARLRGLLALQRDEPAQAVAHLDRFTELAEQYGLLDFSRRLWAVVDLADALIAVDDCARVAQVVDRLDAAARRTGHAVVRGQQRRVLARLVARRDRDLDRAEALAREATDLHQRCPLPLEHGRSLLVLAEVHRLRGEDAAATEERRGAHALFAGIGYRWWADRSADPPPAALPVGELSAGERPVARLVATGVTNREVAAALHLSVRTVENHLAHVYRKLGIRSRTELVRRWPEEPPAVG